MRGGSESWELYLSIPAPGGNDDENADEDRHGEGIERHDRQGEAEAGRCQAVSPALFGAANFTSGAFS